MPKLPNQKVKHNTNAGISWVRDSLPVTTKIAIDILGVRYFEGFSEEEVRTNWNKLAPAYGFISKRHQLEFEEQIDYLIPDFRDYYQLHSRHKDRDNPATLGYTLVHRARCTIYKNETRRFQQPIWRPLYDMVKKHIDEWMPIDPYHRYSVHESIILSQVADEAGVYLRVDPSGSGWSYLGMAEKIGKRHKGHLNSPLHLARAYVTVNNGVAAALEAAIFSKIEPYIVDVRQSGPKGRRGCFRLERGIDPVQLIDEIVDSHYREFCRSKVGLK